MKKLLLIIVFFPVFCFAQKADKECKSLKKGSFNIYEGDSIIGQVYRKDDVQIEKYVSENQFHYVRISEDGCYFTMKKYFINEDNSSDTLQVNIRYKLVKNSFYKYYANVRWTDFKTEGFIKKISNSIPREFKEKFKELSKLDQD